MENYSVFLSGLESLPIHNICCQLSSPSPEAQNLNLSLMLTAHLLAPAQQQVCSGFASICRTLSLVEDGPSRSCLLILQAEYWSREGNKRLVICWYECTSAECRWLLCGRASVYHLHEACSACRAASHPHFQTAGSGVLCIFDNVAQCGGFFSFTHSLLLLAEGDFEVFRLLSRPSLLCYRDDL